KWSNDEWRDAGYTVPAGSSIGTTATDFFCGAVAGASTLLTALVGNPSPVLIALAALFALLLWLTSRTEWGPSEPFQLRRRRRWGAIVAAARRMYFGNFRLFVGIGLLFLPLGVLITALQYLIFRVGGLGPLTDTAGPSNAVVAFLAFAFGLA